jgi:hypothetical protein
VIDYDETLTEFRLSVKGLAYYFSTFFVGVFDLVLPWCCSGVALGACD